MNFEFSEEQNLLREQTRGFLAEHCPMSRVRSILEADDKHDTELWGKIAEMGWTATVIPEEYGGLGLSYLELVVIAEELGRAVAPVPFSSSVYLATEALLAAGNEQQKESWLDKLATGEVIGTFALSEAHGQPTADNLTATVDDGKLSGTKIPVADAQAADIAVIAAKSGTDVGLYLVELDQAGVTREDVRTLDFTRGHARVSFDAANAEALDGGASDWGVIERLLDRAAVLYAWEQVGGAEAALEQAKEYAMGRYAFGRPIASYQAIKHKLAQMYVNNTLARSNCYWGAAALNSGSGELTQAAATCRVSATQAYYYAAKENIQTHGGMGYTWEFDCQFFYRRAKLLSVNIGSERHWQDRLITAVVNSKAA
ncbi:MAG: acyl-CoA dehydrogenase family protein [Pseudomonadales bacterium]|jgi:alkylation response protein AidB-like acyl-CoA dehydrogenase|nr:acyl-CoA dehydrogenase family protein [Pseudomonadales bacterium]MDP6470710.1 acyl-CoA dehydrogenase family protein [Pseudomonadales bacterium]MDP6828338.1 acyl-CoA dehydrogenase family protein [Pseudomonadales bacterium]MDP6972112.1 acyl-CoA dehydrogenase family protein [Pseudomonadales bacterium]|tara:strand:+ start:3791 stop:4903 length:1113 start_codon:yes stop_codon:yes gene_type:complete